MAAQDQGGRLCKVVWVRSEQEVQTDARAVADDGREQGRRHDGYNLLGQMRVDQNLDVESQ